VRDRLALIRSTPEQQYTLTTPTFVRGIDRTKHNTNTMKVCWGYFIYLIILQSIRPTGIFNTEYTDTRKRPRTAIKKAGKAQAQPISGKLCLYY
jgi:hypothetical protein